MAAALTRLPLWQTATWPMEQVANRGWVLCSLHEPVVE